jgi:hypothetical protein
MGPIAAPGLGVAGGWSTGETLEFLKRKARRIDYLAPGRVLPPEEALGLTVYVLGPPRNEKLLRKDAPSGGAAKEVYLTGPNEAAAVDSGARARLLRLGMGDDAADRALAATSHADRVPFARPHQRPLERRGAGAPPIDAPGKVALRASYEDKANAWRMIGEAWSETAEALALNMDSDTNNTSLALALELPDGQVLLFPGDAQVGNWLSWRDQTYTPAVDGPSVTIDDLLRRVVFYKVGHHASHNATLRALGLEKMTNQRRLTAAIPVVEAVARVQGKGKKEPGKGWRMPYGELYSRLGDLTEGRIVRGDGDPALEQAAFAGKPTDPPGRVTPTYDPSGLWVELSFDAA